MQFNSLAGQLVTGNRSTRADQLITDHQLPITHHEITLSSFHRVILSVFLVCLSALLATSQMTRALAPANIVPDEALPPDVVIETVVPNAIQLVAMDFTPDGRLLYTEKTGKVRVVASDVLLPTPAYDFSPGLDTQGERGLLGLAVDPNFVTNHRVWAYHTRKLSNNPLAYENRVVLFELPASNVVVTTTKVYAFPVDAYVTLHNGGNLHFGPDGKLYVTVGDNTYPGQPTPAQDLASPLGKMHRFTPGNPLTVPGDNPWLGRSQYAYGLRNSFDFDFDPISGALFATENGPDCDDELNRLLPGHNYGWRTAYPCDDVGGPSPIYNSIPPLVYWTPSLAPTGLTFYTGDLIPEWKNDLFMCSYKDATTAIHHFKLNAARTAIVSHTVLSDTLNHQPITCRIDLLTSPEGALYYSEGGGYPENNGPIKRLVRRTSLADSTVAAQPSRAVAGGQVQVTIDLKHRGTIATNFTVHVWVDPPAQVSSVDAAQGNIYKSAQEVFWSGPVSNIEAITATYTLQIPDTPTDTYVITNQVQFAAPNATLITLSPILIVNGLAVYLPIVRR
jgi:glucose/arabinose dehydrogenase